MPVEDKKDSPFEVISVSDAGSPDKLADSPGNLADSPDKLADSPDKLADSPGKLADSLGKFSGAQNGNGSQNSEAPSPIVRLRDLTRDFDQAGNIVRVLKGVSFEIFPREFVAIQGTSGSGKSTLLQILGLLDRATGGSYELLGRNVASHDDDELSSLRADTTGFVFQNFYLIPYATALENVLLPGLYSGKSQKHAKERAEFLLESVGLGDRKNFLPSRLSGGQQQRVAMARALFNEPALILADEPTGQLDSATSSDILELLDKFNRQGQTIILVTHDPTTASRAKRRIHIEDGLISSDEILRDEPSC